MENLNEIISKVKDSVAKNMEMEEACKEKIVDLRTKCVENYEKIVKPILEDCHTMAKELCNRYGVWFNVHEDKATEHVLIKYYGNNSNGYYLSIKSDHYSFRPYYTSNATGWTDPLDSDCNWANKEQAIAFSEILSTEDKAEAILSEVCKQYADLFAEVLKKVDADNEILSEKLKTLSDYLSDSHTVEEKEDGTVEIHLGGKKYIGKVVEE